MGEPAMLSTREAMERLGYKKPATVHALMKGAWAVEGGSVRVPGKSRTGLEYRVPLVFLQNWLAEREVRRG